MACLIKGKGHQRKTAFVFIPCEELLLFSTADKTATKINRETNGWECLFSGVGTFALFFRSFKGCYTLACQDSPCCWEMLPAAGCMMALQSHAFPTVGFSPSKQFQTPSDIVHHLLLTHDGQDSAGPSLDLPKTKGVGHVVRLPCISMPCTQNNRNGLFPSPG